MIDEVCGKREPQIKGRSKQLWLLDAYTPEGDQLAIVKLVPSLHSATYKRAEMVEGSSEKRLDFYVSASKILKDAGVHTSLVKVLDNTHYLTRYCQESLYNNFEVIVKNRAVGSTQRNYPGLFEENHKFHNPIVKFDYRVDPVD